MQEDLQARWIFVTDTKNTTVDEIMKNMDTKTRQILRKNERNKVKVREIEEYQSQLNATKVGLKDTKSKRNF